MLFIYLTVLCGFHNGTLGIKWFFEFRIIVHFVSLEIVDLVPLEISLRQVKTNKGLPGTKPFPSIGVSNNKYLHSNIYSSNSVVT